MSTRPPHSTRPGGIMPIKNLSRKTIVILVAAFVIVSIFLFYYWFKIRGKGGVSKLSEEDKKRIYAVELTISKVEIEPSEPTSTDDIRAIPIFKDTSVQFVTFHYRWYVNDKAVDDVDSNILDKKYFKKDDTVYCVVKAVRGPLESEEKISGRMDVRNSPPVFNLIQPNNFEVPGRFLYTITAYDPDGDSLSYRLIEPADYGIYLDKSTGEVTWDIRSDQVPLTEEESSSNNSSPGDESSTGRKSSSAESSEERLPPYVTLVFEVEDSDGSTARSSITLNLLYGVYELERPR